MVRVGLVSFPMLMMLFIVGCSEDDGNSPPMIQLGSTCLLVANMTTLSVINLETGEVANDVFGLGIAPNDIALVGDLVVVVNSTSNDLNFFRISGDGYMYPDGVVDVGVSQNNNPWAAAPDGRGHLLITNMLQNSISVFSIGSRVIERTLPAGVAPEGIIVADGFAYVANTGTDPTYTFHEGSIWKYDLDSRELVDSLQVGINPQDIQLDPLGRFHVVCTGNYADVSGEVYVVAPEPLSVVMTIGTGGAPNHVAFAPDSTAYLSAGGWSGFGDPSGVVMQYRCESGEVIHGWESPIGVGFGASDIAVSQNGRVFVSCFSDNRVDEVREDTVYATFVVGTGPSAIALLE
jgi:hypothetical protein